MIQCNNKTRAAMHISLITCDVKMDFVQLEQLWSLYDKSDTEYGDDFKV